MPKIKHHFIENEKYSPESASRLAGMVVNNSRRYLANTAPEGYVFLNGFEWVLGPEAVQLILDSEDIFEFRGAVRALSEEGFGRSRNFHFGEKKFNALKQAVSVLANLEVD